MHTPRERKRERSQPTTQGARRTEHTRRSAQREEGQLFSNDLINYGKPAATAHRKFRSLCHAASCDLPRCCSGKRTMNPTFPHRATVPFAERERRKTWPANVRQTEGGITRPDGGKLWIISRVQLHNLTSRQQTPSQKISIRIFT